MTIYINVNNRKVRLTYFRYRFDYVSLKRAGANFFRIMFRSNEKTPLYSVRFKQFYLGFGCWEVEMLKLYYEDGELSFPIAVKFLAKTRNTIKEDD